MPTIEQKAQPGDQERASLTEMIHLEQQLHDARLTEAPVEMVRALRAIEAVLQRIEAHLQKRGVG